MERYFFNVHDGVCINDEVGAELPSLDAARAMAMRASGEAILELGHTFWNHPEWRMEVLDGEGALQFELIFSGTGRVLGNMGPH